MLVSMFNLRLDSFQNGFSVAYLPKNLLTKLWKIFRIYISLKASERKNRKDYSFIFVRAYCFFFINKSKTAPIVTPIASPRAILWEVFPDL